jgi:NAD(P)-dependent dehydrogenase (short-subunit alcohol dehydrogenase family)
VIVISSWAGWRFTSFTGAAYGASKMGLAPWRESLDDQEGRHGIRATLVCPGEVATPILRSRARSARGGHRTDAQARGRWSGGGRGRPGPGPRLHQ